MSLQRGGVIGIVGGGQLGRMLAIEAARLGYHAHVYSPDPYCCASEVAFKTTTADYKDKKALTYFANNTDVITVEFENIPLAAANFLAERKPFFPGVNLFDICQHRGREKAFAESCDIAVAPYRIVNDEDALCDAVEAVGTPCIAKLTMQGYDGKGQYVIKDAAQCSDIWRQAEGQELIVEAFVDFVQEASIIIARDADGAVAHFPVTDNVHENGILHTSTAPSSLGKAVQNCIIKYAKLIAEQSNLCGILAIEFFITRDGAVLLNEMAPRPHNSGHWTMDGCSVSQFEQLVRICAGLPLRDATITRPTIMHNIIGDIEEPRQQAMAGKDTTLYDYGKSPAREGRKMGHVNTGL